MAAGQFSSKKIMKIFNLLFKSLFLITLIISISSCKKKTDKKNIDAFCTTYNGRPEQSISYKEMATMITQYKATRANVLKNALGFEDTHTNWVQIDSLKKYLAYVEKLSNDNNIEITGINIISGAYPNQIIYGKEKNFQTLILLMKKNVYLFFQTQIIKNLNIKLKI